MEPRDPALYPTVHSTAPQSIPCTRVGDGPTAEPVCLSVCHLPMCPSECTSASLLCDPVHHFGICLSLHMFRVVALGCWLVPLPGSPGSPGDTSVPPGVGSGVPVPRFSWGRPGILLCPRALRMWDSPAGGALGGTLRQGTPEDLRGRADGRSWLARGVSAR